MILDLDVNKQILIWYQKCLLVGKDNAMYFHDFLGKSLGEIKYSYDCHNFTQNTNKKFEMVKNNIVTSRTKHNGRPTLACTQAGQ